MNKAASYNNGLIQPFVNYNFKEGFYLTSSPVLTVDWDAPSGEKWTVPSAAASARSSISAGCR